MKLVLLTLDGLEHRYVGTALADAYPGALRAIVLAAPPRTAFGRRLSAVWRRYRIRDLWSRALDKVYQRLTHHAERRDQALRAGLFAGGPPPDFPSALVRTVPSHNGAECLALLDNIQPDIIAVYGTDIIRAPVIRSAGEATVNMHTGVSPTYRGADSVFWALHNAQPEYLGATVHLLDEGVDSGPVIATARTAFAPGDDEHTLFAKCVAVGTPLFISAIGDLARGAAVAVPQQLGEGRQYRFADRTVTAECRVSRLLLNGLLRRSAPV